MDDILKDIFYLPKKIEGNVTPKELIVALSKIDVDEKVKIDVYIKMTKEFKENILNTL